MRNATDREIVEGLIEDALDEVLDSPLDPTTKPLRESIEKLAAAMKILNANTPDCH